MPQTIIFAKKYFLKKVLIIAYYFPPCNVTPSQRALSWAKNLKKFGYRPVVLTRRWDHEIKNFSDFSRATPAELVFESKEEYDVYYLPYKPNLRDRIYVKYGDEKFVFIRKLLSLLELLLNNIFIFFIPYSNLFRFAESLLHKDNELRKVIITGHPFNTFKIGYKLHKKFKARWIADYRDAWTSNEARYITKSSFLFNLVYYVDRHFEKKWSSTASFITASSAPIAKSITDLTRVKSMALYNGFIMDDFAQVEGGKFTAYTITYVGSLYNGQKIELFCNALKQLIDSTPGIQIKFLLPGLALYKEQADRIHNLLKGYELYYECSSWRSRKDVLEIEKKSHLLFHAAWDEQKGIIASKIYEYIASGTYILVSPSDHGSIQEIIDSSQCGRCMDTVEETFLFLKNEYENYLLNKFRVNDTSSPRVLQFAREKQVEVLAKCLDSI